MRPRQQGSHLQSSAHQRSLKSPGGWSPRGRTGDKKKIRETPQKTIRETPQN